MSESSETTAMAQGNHPPMRTTGECFSAQHDKSCEWSRVADVALGSGGSRHSEGFLSVWRHKATGALWGYYYSMGLDWGPEPETPVNWMECESVVSYRARRSGS